MTINEKSLYKDIDKRLHLVDTTDLYKKADGTPYEYMGHWSWIYVYNNQCIDTINGKRTTTIMKWLAAQ